MHFFYKNSDDGEDKEDKDKAENKDKDHENKKDEDKDKEDQENVRIQNIQQTQVTEGWSMASRQIEFNSQSITFKSEGRIRILTFINCWIRIRAET